MAQDYQSSSSRQPRRREETQRSSNTRRRKKRSGLSGAAIYAIFVIGVSALLACIGWVAANDVLALNKPEKTATITITNDDSFGDVAEKLKDEGLIEYKFLFNLFATFTRSKDDVVAGTFTLNTDMDYRALLSGMSANSATRATVTVTIPEGYTVDQIFTLLEEKGVASVEDLQDMAANHDYAFSFLQDLELGDYHRLEGYLYPDTYEFTTPQNPLYVINKMLVRFDEQFTDAMRQEVADSGRTIHEIITIASMIEKETDGNDRADIASVIYNRLNNPSSGTQGYLQIDATLAYINGGKVPTEADKSIDSPYNTYLYKGLPAGPISNPGLESIKAAMNPNSTSYYYYALGDDGVHHFFKTRREQQNFIATQELYNK
ncbi:MAG: endolytic transglycosylase MltG [Flintibacter sp.]|uniref:endolytic transglycosylase MltG n=1 Tax=Flintibacter TaxID=1918454 RepID=UPI001F1E092E|nr:MULTISPECIES: endolytic transglycosylase MltG [Eubacteriales]MDY5037940.1 endolytic transglycosylase MltG [Lawsonibacter sp.]MCF2677404.1 endolytic transglycosylase MltG [Pseudoflavonifractor phocaeensis]MCI6150196.1 endolytic transglycosylase MltG [Flintibacter sp.]MCI7159415.1 endolytic transglycosylase MltG [Flintibacter sp.]MDD7116705.1 endolytic transglycosylase MltG [Flintibacter sp.]